MEAHSVSDLHFHLSSENKTDCDKYDFMKKTVNSLPSLEGKREVREYREDTVMAVEIQTTSKNNLKQQEIVQVLKQQYSKYKKK